MLSSLPASTTQIAVVAGAVLLIVGLGSAEVADRLLGWMGLGAPPTSETEPVSNDTGARKAGRL